MNKYEVILTYECNWNCEYCSVNTHNNHITNDMAISKLLSIPECSIVTLSGGEIGLLDKKIIEEFLKILNFKNCELQLNTNGFFLEKYPELLVNFNKIYYHCSEDLNVTDHIIKLQNESIYYMLVVHDKNYHKLDNFINKHNDIVFHIVPASTPNTGIKGSPELCKNNKINILKKYGNILTTESKLFLLGKNFYKDIIYI